MAGVKRVMAMLLVLLTAVMAGSTNPSGGSAQPQREVAALADAPAAAEGEDIKKAAAEEARVSVQENAGEITPEAQTGDETGTMEAASAQTAHRPAQEPLLKEIRLPGISADAPTPAQVKSLPDSGMVCLTFDDGYSEAAIETILDSLSQYGVRCTFFIIGSCLKLYPELWRRAVEEGHEIAYHTMSHRPLTGCSNAQIVADINAWNRVAVNILGGDYRIPKIARAPGGSANTRVRRLFAALGYTLIYWSSDTFTGVYRRSHANAGARAASYILRRTAVGSISLQHFNACDAASVSRYIGELASRFRLGTVGEALAAAKTCAQRQALTERLKPRRAKLRICENVLTGTT